MCVQIVENEKRYNREIERAVKRERERENREGGVGVGRWEGSFFDILFFCGKTLTKAKGRKSPHNSAKNKGIVAWKDGEVDDEDGDFFFLFFFFSFFVVAEGHLWHKPYLLFPCCL